MISTDSNFDENMSVDSSNNLNTPYAGTFAGWFFESSAQKNKRRKSCQKRK